MFQVELRLLGTQVLELRVGRECDNSDDWDEGIEVDPTDYLWSGGRPVSLNHAKFAPVDDDEEIGWDDLEEEWADLE